VLRSPTGALDARREELVHKAKQRCYDVIACLIQLGEEAGIIKGIHAIKSSHELDWTKTSCP